MKATAPILAKTASNLSKVPPFEPHPWFKGGHAQTWAGAYWPTGRPHLPSVAWQIPVDDADAVLVEDAIPSGWQPGDSAAVLLHGLGSCSRANYVVRFGARLHGLGIRVVRMNLRGAGLGFGLARKTYNAGATEDVRKVIEAVSHRAKGSRIALIGFSLGANLALKLASEVATNPLANLDCVIAANPPLDLMACSRQMRRLENRLYDRNFVKILTKQIQRLHEFFPDLGPTGLDGVRTLLEFDMAYTAPRHGFRDVEDYYEQSSAGPRLGKITTPTLIVHALDDPFIPAESFKNLTIPPSLALELESFGGHLGYLSRRMKNHDRRWLDARLAAWLTARWE